MGALLCPHHSPAAAGRATGPAERPAAAPSPPARAVCALVSPPRLPLPRGSAAVGGPQLMVWAAKWAAQWETEPHSSSHLRASLSQGWDERADERPCGLALPPGLGRGEVCNAGSRRLFTCGFEVRGKRWAGDYPGGLILPGRRRVGPKLS